MPDLTGLSPINDGACDLIGRVVARRLKEGLVVDLGAFVQEIMADRVEYISETDELSPVPILAAIATVGEDVDIEEAEAMLLEAMQLTLHPRDDIEGDPDEDPPLEA